MFVRGWCRSPLLPLCLACFAKETVRIILLLHIVNFVGVTVKAQFNNTQRKHVVIHLFVGVQRAMVPQIEGQMDPRKLGSVCVCETDPNSPPDSLYQDQQTHPLSLSLPSLSF